MLLDRIKRLAESQEYNPTTLSRDAGITRNYAERLLLRARLADVEAVEKALKLLDPALYEAIRWGVDGES